MKVTIQPPKATDHGVSATAEVEVASSEACIPSAPTYAKKKMAQSHVTLFLSASLVRPPSLSDCGGLSARCLAAFFSQNAQVLVISSIVAAPVF